MYIIMVYDISEKRVAKVLKLARQYLNWVQNSVLEGELSPAKFKIFKEKVLKIINEKEDSVIFYTFRETFYTSRIILGHEKGDVDNVL